MICKNCCYYLEERGGICGAGLIPKEQSKEDYCRNKVEGPPAQVLGKPCSIWEFTSNNRIEQAPKNLRSFKVKNTPLTLVHYELIRTQFTDLNNKTKRNRTYNTKITLVYKCANCLLFKDIINKIETLSREKFTVDNDDMGYITIIYRDYCNTSQNIYETRNIPQSTKRFRERLERHKNTN